MKILIATGGSGGHIYPALSVARELRSRGHEAFFVGVFGTFQPRIEREGFSCRVISSRGFKTESLKSGLQWIVSMVKSICGSYRIIRESRPERVVGFGGYGAFPLVLVAIVLRVPTIIHEQNVRPGRANRMLAPLVTKIAVSFSQSMDRWRWHRTLFSGCPCRSPQKGASVPEVRQHFGLAEDRLTLLVMGGSQGSLTINRVFLEALPVLARARRFQVIHLTGEAEQEDVRARYAREGIPCYVASFMDEMEQAYTAADVAVCRAGAVTVSELAAFRLPAVLIPYPYAGAHQKENAQVLVKTGLARMTEEPDLTAQVLVKNILAAAETDRALIRVKEVYEPNAAKKIAVELEQLND